MIQHKQLVARLDKAMVTCSRHIIVCGVYADYGIIFLIQLGKGAQRTVANSLSYRVIAAAVSERRICKIIFVAVLNYLGALIDSALAPRCSFTKNEIILYLPNIGIFLCDRLRNSVTQDG